MATKILIDCDPGLDDAIAILMAGKADNISLLGVSAVAGNQTISKTTENARRIVGLGQLDVPVVRGASRPLLRDPIIADDFHGESGLEGIDLPPVLAPLAADNAIPWLAERILAEEEPVTLVPIGPLTNIALLFLTFPDVRNKVERVVLMGGAIGRGNVTPSAEFNVIADPEAAKIVFQSGVPITMVGLDVTRKVIATREVVERIKQLDNSASEYVAAWLTYYIDANLRHTGIEGGAMHDPLAVAAVMNPDVLKVQPMYVDVETQGRLTYGQTVCDATGVMERNANVDVAVDVNEQVFWNLLFETLSRY